MIQNCSELPKLVHMVIKTDSVTKFLEIDFYHSLLKSYFVNLFIDSKNHCLCRKDLVLTKLIRCPWNVLLRLNYSRQRGDLGNFSSFGSIKFLWKLPLIFLYQFLKISKEIHLLFFLSFLHQKNLIFLNQEHPVWRLKRSHVCLELGMLKPLWNLQRYQAMYLQRTFFCRFR